MRKATRLMATWRSSPATAVTDLLIAGGCILALVLMVRDVLSDAWGGVAVDVVIFASAAGMPWLLGRYRRLAVDLNPMRRELLAASRKIGRGEVWLNRADGLVFRADRSFGGVTVMVNSEEELRELADGSAVVITRKYVMFGGDSGVMLHVDGVAGKTVAGKRVWDAEEPGLLRRLRNVGRVFSAYRRGLATPGPEELDAIIAALGDAELIGREGS